MTPKPDSRLPWRVVQDPEGFLQVWTAFDETLGSRNNYVICDSIQTSEEAELIAQAPELQTRVQSLTTSKDAALAILERLRVNLYGGPVPQFDLCREAIEVLNRIISYE